MITTTVRLSLGQYVVQDATTPFVEKKLLAGYRVDVGLVMYVIGPGVFQKGAVLGRARAERLHILAKMLLADADESDEANKSFCQELRKRTQRRLKEYGQDPGELAPFSLQFEFPDYDMLNPATIETMVGQKTHLAEALSLLNQWYLDGIGFGATYPKLLEEVWIKTYEKDKDQDLWANARKYGLDIPEDREGLPLADVEQQVLLEVGLYAHEFFPKLVDALSLRIAT